MLSWGRVPGGGWGVEGTFELKTQQIKDGTLSLLETEARGEFTVPLQLVYSHIIMVRPSRRAPKFLSFGFWVWWGVGGGGLGVTAANRSVPALPASMFFEAHARELFLG